MVASAMAVDAVPYQSADSGADGLLSVLVLLPTHWVGLPPDAESVSGAYGFIASAYQDPNAATDGGTFIIEIVAADGRREVVLKRRLNPVANPEDRGPVAFKLELSRSEGGQLEFTVEPGEGNGYDWTYWQGLECRLRASVNELSK